MKKLGKYSLLMVSLITFSQVVIAQKVNSFSLQQAVDYAKQNSVQVKNAMLDILLQQQTNRDITSIALPQINGSGSVTDYLVIPTTLVPAQFFGGNAGEFAPVKFGTKWSACCTENEFVFCAVASAVKINSPIINSPLFPIFFIAKILLLIIF